MELTEIELKTLKMPKKLIEQDETNKPWEEISDKHKIERLRSIIKIRDAQYSDLSMKVSKLIETLREHSHNNFNNVVIPVERSEFYGNSLGCGCGNTVPSNSKPWF